MLEGQLACWEDKRKQTGNTNGFVFVLLFKMEGGEWVGRWTCVPMVARNATETVPQRPTTRQQVFIAAWKKQQRLERRLDNTAAP